MRFRNLLIVSLLLNLCLAVLAVYQFTGKAKKETAKSGEEPDRPVVTNTGTPPKSQRDWASIKSSDWKQYVKNLRSTGCPEETLRDIVIAEINKTYAARWRSMNGDDGKNYWISKRDGWWGHTKQKQFNTLEREKKELIQEVLGVDADVQLRKYLVLNYDASVEVRQLDFLTDTKRRQVNQALDRDDRRIQAIWLKQEPGGSLPAAAQHEMNLALQQRKQDLATMLTPTELEEYDLRNSALAKDLRRQLYGFDATEKEFRSVFQVQKALHDKFADLPPNPTDENVAQKRAVSTEMAERQIKEALGEQRYADYLRARTVSYQQLLNFTDEFEFPKEIANQAYEIIKGAGEKVKQCQADTNLSTELRQGKIAALQTETDAALNKAMGEKGLKYYKQNYGGWMGNAGR